jgi:hypothetical protein
MKTLAILSLFAISVSAKSQSSGSSSGSAPAAASTTASPIPASVSSGCSTFLSSLDSDSSLQSCLSSINSATKSITPNSSASDLSTALGSICGSSTSSACTETLFRTQLTNFLANCKNELTGSNPNTDVQNVYDSLYLIAPYKESVCSQDASQNYCVNTIAKQAASGGSLLGLAKGFLSIVVQLPLSKRDSPFSPSGTYLVPNATTFQAASLPYMFLNGNTAQATLCSTCSQAILKPYLAFESSIADALTVSGSRFLGGQKDLWNALQNQCGSDFASGVVANAGATPPSNNVTIGGSLGAATSVKVSATGIIAAFVGAFIAL